MLSFNFSSKNLYASIDSWKGQLYQIENKQLLLSFHKAILVTPKLSFLKDMSFELSQLPNEDSEKVEIFCHKFLSSSLTSLSQSQYSNSRLNYQDFLSYYRSALQTRYYLKARSKDFKNDTVSLLHTIAFFFYSGVDLSSFSDLHTNTVAAAGDYKPLSSLVFHEKKFKSKRYLSEFKKAIIETKIFSKALSQGTKKLNESLYNKALQGYHGGVTWSDFDLNYTISLPSVKFTVVDKKSRHKVKFIRMSTPNIGSDDQSYIAPEFLAYLRSLKSRRLKHVYINLQDNRNISFKSSNNAKDMLRSVGINYDYFRSKALEDLNKNDELKDTVEVISLSKDNDFYNQTGVYHSTQEEPLKFLNKFSEILFNTKGSGYHFPEKWLKNHSQEKKDLNHIFALLMDLLFPNKNILTTDDKQVFIEIAYFFIADYASRRVYSINLSCKDGIDRAGSSNALAYFLYSLVEALENRLSKKDFKIRIDSLNGVIFSDALLVKKRVILYSRFKNFKKASLHILDLLMGGKDNQEKFLRLLNSKKLSNVFLSMKK